VEHYHHRTSALEGIAQQRNAIIRTAAASSKIWFAAVCFVDSDIVLQPDTLVRLWNDQHAVVAAPYTPRWAACPVVPIPSIQGGGDEGNVTTGGESGGLALSQSQMDVKERSTQDKPLSMEQQRNHSSMLSSVCTSTDISAVEETMLVTQIDVVVPQQQYRVVPQQQSSLRLERIWDKTVDGMCPSTQSTPDWFPIQLLLHPELGQNDTSVPCIVVGMGATLLRRQVWDVPFRVGDICSVIRGEDVGFCLDVIRKHSVDCSPRTLLGHQVQHLNGGTAASVLIPDLHFDLDPNRLSTEPAGSTEKVKRDRPKGNKGPWIARLTTTHVRCLQFHSPLHFVDDTESSLLVNSEPRFVPCVLLEAALSPTRTVRG